MPWQTDTYLWNKVKQVEYYHFYRDDVLGCIKSVKSDRSVGVKYDCPFSETS